MRFKRPHPELGIRITPLRHWLIELFRQNPGTAFSESEINSIVGNDFDRTTIYRCIRVLLERVFIHRIVCEDGVLKYALTSKQLVRDHPHFQCTVCGTVSCLHCQRINEFQLPDGYELQQTNLLIQGVCAKCKR